MNFSNEIYARSNMFVRFKIVMNLALTIRDFVFLGICRTNNSEREASFIIIRSYFYGLYLIYLPKQEQIGLQIFSFRFDINDFLSFLDKKRWFQWQSSI
jgi:hypothetical protein